MAEQKVIEISEARCDSIGGSLGAGNTQKGAAKFTIEQHEASVLLENLGQHAYSATFGGKLLGHGLTIAGVSGKPDEGGEGSSSLTLNAPQAAIADLAKVMAHGLGKVSSLVLTEDQMSMGLLTERVE